MLFPEDQGTMTATEFYIILLGISIYHQVSPSILVNAKHIYYILLHCAKSPPPFSSCLSSPIWKGKLTRNLAWLQPWTSHVLNQCIYIFLPWCTPYGMHEIHIFVQCSWDFFWRRSRVWVQICCPSWRRAGESGWVKCFSNSLVIFRGFCRFSGFLLGFRWILWDVFRDSDCGIYWFSGIHVEFRVGFHGVTGTDLSNTDTHGDWYRINLVDLGNYTEIFRKQNTSISQYIPVTHTDLI